MQTVVIADDNTAFADEIKKFFSENTEFKVLGVAGDGVEAIKMVERMKPDFLLLDIVLPELDGFGVFSALGAFAESPVTITLSLQNL